MGAGCPHSSAHGRPVLLDGRVRNCTTISAFHISAGSRAVSSTTGSSDSDSVGDREREPRWAATVVGNHASRPRAPGSRAADDRQFGMARSSAVPGVPRSLGCPSVRRPAWSGAMQRIAASTRRDDLRHTNDQGVTVRAAPYTGVSSPTEVGPSRALGPLGSAARSRSREALKARLGSAKSVVADYQSIAIIAAR